ncbi:MAG TPA: zinc-finger domain-containing protein [Bauldia sp.]|nr:zinc-finger domain-containing protein [Bauldia sp.]
MADHGTPHFQNSAGDRAIAIGVKEFMCVGAEPPFDHPHIFIDMGDADEKVCPYCSTLYRYRSSLGATETDPPGHLYLGRAA